MEQIKGSVKVEFANLIALALKKSIPWTTLSVIIDSTTLNEEQSKDVIKILLKKLEQLHEELQEKQDKVSRNLKMMTE